MFRLTPAVRIILIINVVLFVAKLMTPGFETDCRAEGVLYPTERFDLVTKYLGLWHVQLSCFKPYQLFTYMFVHGNFMHILLNMLILASMAPHMEMRWGSQRFVLFYVATGLGAAVFSILVHMFFDLPGAAVTVGASGAIYGVLLAFGMTFPNLQLMLIIPPVPIRAKYMVFVFFGLSLLLGGANVAHLAHLGGIVVGYIIMQIWRARGYW